MLCIKLFIEGKQTRFEGEFIIRKQCSWWGAPHLLDMCLLQEKTTWWIKYITNHTILNPTKVSQSTTQTHDVQLLRTTLENSEPQSTISNVFSVEMN